MITIMNRSSLTLIAAIAWNLINAQNYSENYTKVIVPRSEAKDQVSLDALSDDQKSISVSYLDGLGRLKQEVAYKQSPSKKDIVQVYEYDENGRQSRSYLPYMESTGTMLYRPQAVLKQSEFYGWNEDVARSRYPYSDVVYEANPIDWVEQSAAPGEDWKVGSGHTVRNERISNGQNEVRLWDYNSNGDMVSLGFYPAQTLEGTLTYDENGYKTYQYKDRKGNLILKKTQYGVGSSDFTYTYYIYDVHGNLSFVVPPKQYAVLESSGNYNLTTVGVYSYLYDKYNRLRFKKVPSQGWYTYVYDDQDRLRLKQGPEQKQLKKWSFYKYDQLGRLILEGEVTDIRTGAAIMADVKAQPTVEERTSTNYAAQHGYTNQSYPTTSTEILSVKYYDDYDYDFNGVTASDPSYEDISSTGITVHDATARTMGMVTGTKVKVLGSSNTYLEGTMFYDDKGRVIQSYAENYLGGFDRVTNYYDFADQLLHSCHQHDDGGGVISKTITEWYSYDHAGRLIETRHQVDSDPAVMLSKKGYNPLGQLMDEKIYSTNLSNPSNFLQSVDYAYNIRGWLTYINNADLSNQSPGLAPVDVNINNFNLDGLTLTATTFSVFEAPCGAEEGRTMSIQISSGITAFPDNEQFLENELYNPSSIVIELETFNDEGDPEPESLFGQLEMIANTPFSITFDGELILDESTTNSALEAELDPLIETSLDGYEGEVGEQARQEITAALKNYFYGRANLPRKREEAFASDSHLVVSFKEEHSSQIYMTVYNSYNQETKDYLIAQKQVCESNEEYYQLLGYVNPTPTSFIIDFETGDLFEGMPTIDAREECMRVFETTLDEQGISEEVIKLKLRIFAMLHAVTFYGRTAYNNDDNDLWGMELKYNNTLADLPLETGNPLSSQRQYNGNIAEMIWKSKGDEVKRGYGYSYDGLNRIKNANYAAFSSASELWDQELDRYNISNISYDLNGNFQTLRRNGYKATSGTQFGMVDDLTYTYAAAASDRLVWVDDNSSVNGFANDFKDGNTTSSMDYDYDLGGNLILDRNKGITNISYNHLNLPVHITTTTGTIDYIYDANGTKLSKVVTTGGNTNTTYYTAIGNYTQLNSNPKQIDFLFVEGGRVVADAGLTNRNWRYEFYYTDHLGNTRLGYSDYDESGAVDATEITQQQNYYPFGLEHKGTSYGVATQTTHQYLYNGKELQGELSLNWLDYGARNYDPALGRWYRVDELSELYYSNSPYVYALNTPTNAIDPDGNLVIFINGNHFGDGAKGYKGWAGNSYGSAFKGDYNFKGTRSYWSTGKSTGFDISVMNHLGDHSAIYRDGGIGGFMGALNPGALSVGGRMLHGYGQGKIDAEQVIASLSRDKNGNIIESIKVISHSMGGAYAKGYIKALLEYAKANGIEGVVVDFEADFAPFQSGSQKALEDENMGPTLQFSHDKDMVAGDDPIDGADQQDTSNDEGQGHSIFDFFKQIEKLPEGNYKVENGEIVPKN